MGKVSRATALRPAAVAGYLGDGHGSACAASIGKSRARSSFEARQPAAFIGIGVYFLLQCAAIR
jgi:hypothetical protein